MNTASYTSVGCAGVGCARVGCAGVEGTPGVGGGAQVELDRREVPARQADLDPCRHDTCWQRHGDPDGPSTSSRHCHKAGAKQACFAARDDGARPPPLFDRRPCVVGHPKAKAETAPRAQVRGQFGRVGKVERDIALRHRYQASSLQERRSCLQNRPDRQDGHHSHADSQAAQAFRLLGDGRGRDVLSQGRRYARSQRTCRFP